MDASPDNRFSSAADFRDAVLEAAAVEATARETETREAAAKEAAAREAAAKEAASKKENARRAAAAQRQEIAKESARKVAAAKDAADREVAKKETVAKEAAAKGAAPQPRPEPPGVVAPIPQRGKTLPPIAVTGTDPKKKSKARLLTAGVFAAILVTGGAVAIRAVSDSKSDGANAAAASSIHDSSALVGGISDTLSPIESSGTTPPTSNAASRPGVKPSAGNTAAKPAAKGATSASQAFVETAKKAAAVREAAEREAADSIARARRSDADRDSAIRAAAFRDAAAKAAASRAAPSNPPVATKEIPPGPTRNMSAEIRDVVERCVGALRSNNADQMAQLYVATSPQDIANRDRLLARMRRSSVSVASRPVVGAPEIDGESARTDFTLRLTWRGTFGKRPEVAVKFRATIAPADGGSQIACRIHGTADL